MAGQKARSRREVKKDATRRRILAAGIRIFSERGIDAPTVDEIAAAADVGKGTIYNYFAAKEDIVAAFMVELEKEVQQKAARLSKSSWPLERVLTEFVKYHLRAKEPYHGFVRMFLGQMFSGGEAFYPRVTELQAVINPPLETLFGRLRERRLIRDDIPMADLIQVFKMMQLGLTSAWVLEGPPWKLTRQLVRQQVRIFCGGIQKGGKS
jgi:AcrR family transcriptional regulator